MARNQFTDTIVARATPPGEGGVAIVRLSGPDAIRIAGAIFDGPDLSALPGGHIVHGWVRISSHDGSDSTSDETLTSVMRAPHSYTGEDVVEINCHGGMRITEEIIDACVSLGARRAERGEFTERAFLNGRLDLAQAEAVLDLVQARTRSGLSAACFQLSGALSDRLRTVADRLTASLSRIEAGLEFAEEDLGVGEPGAERDTVALVRDTVSELLGTYRRGKLMTDGATVAIIGAPNVGKSSLMNAILGEERAIVSPIPGTTRDLVEGEVELDGLRVRLVDTAGLRETGDAIEREGTRRAESAAESADLTVLVCDASGAVPIASRTVPAHASLVVLNKIDIANDSVVTGLREVAGTRPTFAVSALRGSGIDRFAQGLRDALIGDEVLNAEGGVITRQRHADALARCAEHLDRSLDQIVSGGTPDLVAADLRLALDEIGQITGETTPDTVLDAIFEEFCIGK